MADDQALTINPITKRSKIYGDCVFPDIMARAAEKQFWGCPELVEGLLPFMDTLSIRRLVQVVIILALAMLIMVIFMEPLTEAWPSLLQSC